MIPAARRSLYDVLRIVSSQVTLFLKKKLHFFTHRCSFQQHRCLQMLYRPIPEVGMENSPARHEHSDVSQCCVYIDDLQT